MEYLAVQGSAPAGTAYPAAQVESPGDPSSEGFAAAMNVATSPAAETVRSAEGLIGTQVRAPEGGCGCDALASTVAAPPEPVRPEGSRGVEPGDLLELSEPGGLGRSHLAVARSAREMISVGGDGVVRVNPIPLERLIGILRP